MVRQRGREAATPVILYLHGGGYTTGSPRTHRALTGHLAVRCGARLFVPDYRLAAGLSRLLSTEMPMEAGLALAGASAWTRRNFARWLFEDEPRAVALTPGRWHRHFLDRDGAYAAESA